MAIDVHIHTRGGEDGEKILKAMDEVGLERVVLFAVAPHRSDQAGEAVGNAHRPSIDDIARICAPEPDRLIGFAWIQPTLPDALEAIDYTFGEKGLRGVKMIPDSWYPDDESAQACYAKIADFGRPMLFHSGILWAWGNTSRFCRPARYEIMMDYPKIRFALAHMSWPWTDECFAVCGKMKWMQPERGHEWTAYIDITTGAPRAWKTDALRKALSYLGDEHIVYGSDCSEPEDADALRHRLDEDRDILREVGASAESAERIMSANALRWLGID